MTAPVMSATHYTTPDTIAEIGRHYDWNNETYPITEQKLAFK